MKGCQTNSVTPSGSEKLTLDPVDIALRAQPPATFLQPFRLTNNS